jgi:hypothetical protein
MAEQSKPKNETATASTNETAQASPDRPKSFPTKVRVTQFPDRELEVDESEYNNLAAQGLLVSQNKE